MQITIAIKNVYGQQNCYPVCAKAKAFATLTKKKTLSAEDLQVIKALGYQVKIQPQTLEGVAALARARRARPTTT